MGGEGQGDDPDPQGRETPVQVQNTLKNPTLRAGTIHTHNSLPATGRRQIFLRQTAVVFRCMTGYRAIAFKKQYHTWYSQTALHLGHTDGHFLNS